MMIEVARQEYERSLALARFALQAVFGSSNTAAGGCPSGAA